MPLWRARQPIAPRPPLSTTPAAVPFRAIVARAEEPRPQPGVVLASSALGFSSTPAVPPDLISALIQALDQDGTVPGLFGQAGAAIKFWGDEAPPSTAL